MIEVKKLTLKSAHLTQFTVLAKNFKVFTTKGSEKYTLNAKILIPKLVLRNSEQFSFQGGGGLGGCESLL